MAEIKRTNSSENIHGTDQLDRIEGKAGGDNLNTFDRGNCVEGVL